MGREIQGKPTHLGFSPPNAKKLSVFSCDRTPGISAAQRPSIRRRTCKVIASEGHTVQNRDCGYARQCLEWEAGGDAPISMDMMFPHPASALYPSFHHVPRWSIGVGMRVVSSFKQLKRPKEEAREGKEGDAGENKRGMKGDDKEAGRGRTLSWRLVGKLCLTGHVICACSRSALVRSCDTVSRQRVCVGGPVNTSEGTKARDSESLLGSAAKHQKKKNSPQSELASSPPESAVLSPAESAALSDESVEGSGSDAEVAVEAGSAEVEVELELVAASSDVDVVVVADSAEVELAFVVASGSDSDSRLLNSFDTRSNCLERRWPVQSLSL
ncbi:hypothetical protein C8F01DRAFT_1091204 [Mycena amicta]|nr:hypothetical protein C8F01DRAFT_1091204 [Mycena amicta]